MIEHTQETAGLLTLTRNPWLKSFIFCTVYIMVCNSCTQIYWPDNIPNSWECYTVFAKTLFGCFDSLTLKFNIFSKRKKTVLKERKLVDKYKTVYHFYRSLFEPSANSKLINDEFLTEQTVETLLNKIFSTNK